MDNQISLCLMLLSGLLFVMKFFYNVLSSEHGIIHFPDFKQIPKFLIKDNSKERINIISAGLWQSGEGIKPILRTYSLYLYLALRYPYIKFLFCTNTELEYRLYKPLQKFGVRVIFCNHNCFLDERIFTIDSVEKKYDALYNARMVGWKNHYLCKDIKNLALITYLYDSEANELFEYLKKELHDATWLNFKGGTFSFLTNEQVTTCINKSYCTLALSEREGAMYASMESLLCGVPVISVKSKGGRDVFFNEGNSIIVGKNLEEVKKAVEFVQSSKFDAQSIRDDALMQIKMHRDYYKEAINEIAGDLSMEFCAYKSWDNYFVNKMRRDGNFATIQSELQLSISA